MNKTRLFVWMIILTMLAGVINGLAVNYYGITVSHLTGVITNFGISISKGDLKNMGWLFSVIIAFLVGSILAGYITEQRSFYLYKRYGWIIIAIGITLAMGVLFFKNSNNNLIRLFAFLMGLQNGLVVSFKGVVVRMTHMSGNITDLGVFIGYRLRGKVKEKAETGLVPLGCLLGFTIGAVLGIFLYKLIGIVAYYLIAIIYVILGGIYFILQKTCIDKDFNDIPDELEKK